MVVSEVPDLQMHLAKGDQRKIDLDHLKKYLQVLTYS